MPKTATSSSARAVHIERMRHAHCLYEGSHMKVARRTDPISWPKANKPVEKIVKKLDEQQLFEERWTYPFAFRSEKMSSAQHSAITLSIDNADFKNKLPFPGVEHCEEMRERTTSYTEDDLALLKQRRDACQAVQQDGASVKANDAKEDKEAPEAPASGPRSLYTIALADLGPFCYHYDKANAYSCAIVVARSQAEAREFHPSGCGKGFEEQMKATCVGREDDWKEATKYDSKVDPESPAPGWWFYAGQGWVPPAYVSATFITSYDGPLPPGAVLMAQ